jgi:hypothetical protein
MVEQLETAGSATAPVVEIQFTLASGDYVRAMRAFLLRDARVWIAMGMVVVIFAGGIANLVAVGELNLMGFFLLLFPLVLTAYLWWGWPASIGRRAQRDRRLRSPTTCQVKDEQFMTQNMLGESCLEWEAFHRIIETRSYYLFVFALNRRTFVLVPRRAFASAEQEATFQEIVKRHLGGRRE